MPLDVPGYLLPMCEQHHQVRYPCSQYPMLSVRLFLVVPCVDMTWFRYNTVGLPVAAGVLFPVLRVTLPPALAGGAMVREQLCYKTCFDVWGELY